MGKERPGEKIKRRRVTFTFKAPEANQVNLMGDFNRWSVKAHPMKKDRNGIWKKAVMLHPGRYEYRFVVDGEWRNDPANNLVCANCYGSQNNLITVVPS